MKTFGRRAEIVAENLDKGSCVYLEGRKRTEFWDDKQVPSTTGIFYVDRIEFLDRKGSGNSHVEPAGSNHDETTVTGQETPF